MWAWKATLAAVGTALAKAVMKAMPPAFSSSPSFFSRSVTVIMSTASLAWLSAMMASKTRR